ncbi:hypothetical protein BT96DRAFT_923500 [Gymnopus androsaceus JB14]|uniref:Uncharacterized protein n=1 Tax=Gymnopus androsaceus JB14 TaxID=1447944 RepID=A0A6A4H8C0_9AGAR|nr:hypothetical protein BT96DRAFT_923500 [Gymnopus androsaceus JB14]
MSLFELASQKIAGRAIKSALTSATFLSYNTPQQSFLPCSVINSSCESLPYFSIEVRSLY